MACLRSIHHIISKLLGRLEYRNEARFNHNFLVGPRVSCGTRSTFLHAERSKAPDLDPVLLHERILDYSDKAIDHSFCFYFRKSGASCDTIDDVSLCHSAGMVYAKELMKNLNGVLSLRCMQELWFPASPCALDLRQKRT